jgi:hypothetical protein
MSASPLTARPGWPSWWPVLPILLVAVLLYGGTLHVYYCSYDDFREFRRSALEDSQDWTRTFTTSHFNTFRYRPLSRLIQLWTWRITPDSPLSSRVRNVACHLANIALIFGIARLLFGNLGIAAGAALLFAVKPSANQHISGAVWPNMVSHLTLMVTLYVFLRVWRGRRSIPGAIAVALLGWLTTLQYEASLTIFASICIYGLIDWLWKRNPRPPLAFVTVFCLASAMLVGGYMGARRLAHGGWLRGPQPQPVATVVKTQVALWSAISTPVDYVLLSRLLDEPLPPETSFARMRPLEFSVAAGILAFAGLLLWRARRLHRAGLLDLPHVVFLVIACALTFSLQSLFVPPSESYIYPASGLLSILIAYLLLGEGFLSSGPAAARQLRAGGAMVGVLVLLGAAAVTLRNQELAVCGATVRNIHDGLPVAQMKQGDWRVAFAAVPDQPLPVPYALCQRRGVWAVGWNEFRSAAFDWAVQLWTMNPRAHGELLSAEEMPAACAGPAPGRLCFWVDARGMTSAWRPGRYSRVHP